MSHSEIQLNENLRTPRNLRHVLKTTADVEPIFLQGIHQERRHLRFWSGSNMLDKPATKKTCSEIMAKQMRTQRSKQHLARYTHRKGPIAFVFFIFTKINPFPVQTRGFFFFFFFFCNWRPNWTTACVSPRLGNRKWVRSDAPRFAQKHLGATSSKISFSFPNKSHSPP